MIETGDELPETEAEWRDRLSDAEYRILRDAGTERRFSSDLLHVDEAGVFRCAGCGQVLFDADAKFDSGTGWPSFVRPADEEAVETRPDRGRGTVRTEVRCRRCGGHLGHVFDDGPEPTGKRYCINGAALSFDPDDE
ncbi:MAG: peptide-methionine (R)-S-oxide reductase MsrB [Haloarculaceae archaeon]